MQFSTSFALQSLLDRQGMTKKSLQEFIDSKYRHIARDKNGQWVFMAETKSWLQMVEENFPDVKFHMTSEF